MKMARPPPKIAELLTRDEEKKAEDELPPIHTAPPVPRMLSGLLATIEVGRGEGSAVLLVKSERETRVAGTSLMNRAPPFAAEELMRVDPLTDKEEHPET